MSIRTIPTDEEVNYAIEEMFGFKLCRRYRNGGVVINDIGEKRFRRNYSNDRNVSPELWKAVVDNKKEWEYIGYLRRLVRGNDDGSPFYPRSFYWMSAPARFHAIATLQCLNCWPKNWKVSEDEE